MFKSAYVSNGVSFQPTSESVYKALLLDDETIHYLGRIVMALFYRNVFQECESGINFNHSDVASANFQTLLTSEEGKSKECNEST